MPLLNYQGQKNKLDRIKHLKRKHLNVFVGSHTFFNYLSLVPGWYFLLGNLITHGTHRKHWCQAFTQFITFSTMLWHIIPLLLFMHFGVKFCLCDIFDTMHIGGEEVITQVTKPLRKYSLKIGKSRQNKVSL